MNARLITGAVLTLFYLSLVYFQGWYFKITVVIASCLCMYELYDAFRKKGMIPIQWLCFAYPPALLGAYTFGRYLGQSESLLLPTMLVFSMISLVVMVARKEPDYLSLSATMFTMIYPGIMLALLYPLIDIEDKLLATMMLVLSMAIALMGDICALFVGSRFGKHKLCPNISPNKTVEGALGGLAASVLTAVIVALGFGFFRETSEPLWYYLLLGLVAGACSQCGDLTASIVKRYCGEKDFGTIFPGHGGMMDRMDSCMFNIVVVYMYCKVMQML